ncbi:BRISC and BRCA1-A complex member 2 [Bagarius yarrelli]|uniref:BRISC and BRCA1-A complex member 2 n=1 Tax=Bagarius yarrelli TaxID=175774 RepID=A0A556U566_BAGYA|nr:BRISC and BRCA1-A complex member 2 [Bagarius yarrelli]
MNSLSPELALSRISPDLRPLLCTVVRNGRVGLDSTNCLRITDLKSGCTSLTPGPCCDRFKLHIPYAGETLKWDIIFNAKDPELPPDFIFGDDAEFLPEPSELPQKIVHSPPTIASIVVYWSHCDICLADDVTSGVSVSCPHLDSQYSLERTAQTLSDTIKHFLLPDIDLLRKKPVQTARHTEHLVDWDSNNSECLLHLVKELLQQYHQYQCQRLRESSRLLFEYDSLLEDPNYGRSMEIYAGRKNSWTGEFSARFLLKLPVDFSNIPIYLLKFQNMGVACVNVAPGVGGVAFRHVYARKEDTALDPGEDVALLSVSFEDAEATQVFPKLFLSPSIEHALGGPSALHIPAFPSGGCLIDYVPQVCQLLTNKVQYVIQGYHKRREYIAAFLSHFGMGVVEYDAVGFTKLTLLLMWKDFCFLVHDQPTLTFQSIYHFSSSGQLYSQVQKSYPYSPRWDGNEMAKRAKVYFKSFIPQFQEGAFANGKL